jgi:predicted component of viral defense system (DUF524 family)
LPIINLKTCLRNNLQLEILPNVKESYRQISEAEANENGEGRFQIYEGHTYEYAIKPEDYRIENKYHPYIFSQFKTHPSCGLITPGIFVGTLQCDIVNSNNPEDCCSVFFEVCSIKADYRTEYRYMLEDITDKCTDILMQHSSPVSQPFENIFSKDSETLYQKFSFIKAIIQSEEFINAVHKILLSPAVRWAEEYDSIDIRNAGRIRRQGLKQIASASVRVGIPDSSYLNSSLRLKTLPERIFISKKVETVDIPENRFVKHALITFLSFISEIKNRFNKTSREYFEAKSCESSLEELTGHAVFKQVSSPSSLALNSPILQRKEGYREIYKAWLMFDLAARLIWKGGGDIYSAGKRDIAVLYEYWVFFKLLDLFSSIFQVKQKPADELIKQTADGMGLTLKSGIHFPLIGVFMISGRKMNVQLSYNRTFQGCSSEGNYPRSGSWTVSMRPDYTLTVWPDGFDENEAEATENIVHIHFDAKYKINNIKELFGQKDEDLNDELIEQKKGYYKRADLLKMHSYKDAVRRTAGAYIIYPGTEKLVRKGYHELIPGLGAFAIKPSKEKSGLEELKRFILDVLNSFISKSSQLEKMSYSTYDIHKKKDDDFVLNVPVPEKYDNERSKPPSEIYVLVGYYQEKQKEWIEEKHLYNVRFEEKITKEMIGADYLLLYSKDPITCEIWEMKEKGPELWKKEILIENGYPRPSSEEYYVFQLRKSSSIEFDGCRWDTSKLNGFNKKWKPFAATLLELMKVKEQM